MILRIISDYNDNGSCYTAIKHKIMFRGNSINRLNYMVDITLSDPKLKEKQVFTDCKTISELYGINMASLDLMHDTSEEILFVTKNCRKYRDINMKNIVIILIDESNTQDVHLEYPEYIADSKCFWRQYGTGENNNFILFQSAAEQELILHGN